MGYPMNREHRLFSELATFEDAFPSLSSAMVEYREDGPGSQGGTRVADSSDGTLDGLIACGNPGCKQGGYEIDLILHAMIEGRETSHEGTLACAGTERVGTIVTDPTEVTRDFFTNRLEPEVEQYEYRTGKSYPYDGTLTEAMRKGVSRSSGRCPNSLWYRVALTYRSGA